jgi:signal peptidase
MEHRMKKIILFVWITSLSVVAIALLVANFKGIPVLSYVYSNSMESVIQVNDGFIVLPQRALKVGDIIMYRPVSLQASYITHRIVGITEYGYITKGDNAPCQDQDSGEPAVDKDRIVGRVVTIDGRPIVFPGLGKFSSCIHSGLEKYFIKLSMVFLGLGIITALFPRKRSNRMRKVRYRLRLRHIYHGIMLIAVIFTVISVCMGSKISKIRYLVSEYPAKTGDQVEQNKSGQLIMTIKNMGFFPVWTIISAEVPLQAHDLVQCIMPRHEEKMILDVLPQQKTGIYYGYIRVSKYPVFLPRAWMVLMHRIHPAMATIAVGFSLGLWLYLFFMMMNRVPGFELWIPLCAIRDKIFDRRMKQAKAKIIGRRKVRV